MLVAMFPMIVHADDEAGSFDELQQAINSSDSSVMLTKNYEHKDTDECDYITITKPMMVMLMGVSIDRNLTALPTDGKEGHVFKVEEGGYLMLMNVGGDTSLIKGGYAEDGAGIYVAEGGKLDLYDNIVITSNTSTNYGGGIYLAGAMTTIETGKSVGSTVVGNTAANGRDIYLTSSGTLSANGRPVFGDLLLAQGKTIDFTDNLYMGATIGVSTEDSVHPCQVTNGYASNKNTTIYSDVFTSPQGTVSLNDNGEVQIGDGSSVLPELNIAYGNMTLDGSIGFNVYVDLGQKTVDDMEGAYMIFNVGGEQEEREPVPFDSGFSHTEGSKTYYGFRCDLSSMQLNTNIVCLLYDADGNLLDNTDNVLNPDNYLKAIGDDGDIMGKALSNYVYYLWEYLKGIHLTGDTAWTTNYARVTRNYSEVYKVGYYNDYALISEECEKNNISAATKSIEGSDIAKVTFQLEFNTTNAFMIYFYLKSDSTYTASSIPVTVNGVNKRAYKVEDGKYRVRIDKIYAQTLNTEYVIESNCADVGDFTVTASPMSYVYTALCNSASSTSKKNAMVSVYWLWYWANEYNSQT